MSAGVTGDVVSIFGALMVSALGVVESVPVDEPGPPQAKSDTATKAINRKLFIRYNFDLIN